MRGALVALIKPPPERLPLASEIGVPEMVGALGPALLSSSQATSDVQETLERVAAAYERPDLRVFVLPTLVIVEDPGVAPSHTAIYPANNQQLRLDQRALSITRCGTRLRTATTRAPWWPRSGASRTGPRGSASR